MPALDIQKMPEAFHQNALAQHVMLVDGNLHQRQIFSELLKNKLRYKLTEMSSGPDALRYFSQYAHELNMREVDVILLDISTVENAFSILSDVRRLMPNVPVIVLVQYGDYQSAADALLLGAQDFLTKPVAEARMNVTLRNCIQLRNASRDAITALTGQHSASTNSPVNLGTESVISLINANGDAKKIEEIELAAIRFAIRFYNGRMTEVARKLGIGRSTLYRKLEVIGEF